jgi:ribosomal protein L23
MVKVWFPAFYMRLIKSKTLIAMLFTTGMLYHTNVPIITFFVVNKYQNSAVFYIPPKMTKFEVKEYLQKIYKVGVLDVRTANMLGKLSSFKYVAICFVHNILTGGLCFLLYRQVEAIFWEKEGYFIQTKR